MLLILPRRRDCARSVRESSNDLNILLSWVRAVWSVTGFVLPLVALVRSTLGREVENVAVRWFRVAMSVVLACPMGKATNSTVPYCFLRAAMRGGVLVGLGFEFVFTSQVPT